MNKKAFTIVELVVVITILVILSAIWFSSYSDYLSEARDSQRKADLIQIESAMKNYKIKRWAYPTTWSGFNIRYGSDVLAVQWVLNNTVVIWTLDKLPIDPKVKKEYSFSTTSNQEEFQIAWTLENNGKAKAIVMWDYKTVSKNILPTILVASDSNIDISLPANIDRFIFDWQKSNLPYQMNWNWFKYNWTDILSETWKNSFWQNSNYNSCTELAKAKKLLSTTTHLTYQVINNSWWLVDVTCP